jgi:hypothetical protein
VIENAYSRTLKEECERFFSKRSINIIESISIDDPHLDLERLIEHISSKVHKIQMEAIETRLASRHEL